MIWQFGERGYDLSINRCENGSVSNDCRLSPKPPYWQYLNNPDRIDLFQVMAKLNELKQTYPEFTPETFDYNLSGALKWYRLNNGNNHVLTVGNFGTSENLINVTFQENGKWFEFFSRDSIEVSSTQQSIALLPGEYRIYSTRKFNDPGVVTETEEFSSFNSNIQVYPNPANSEINISSQKPISQIQIYSLTGEIVFQENSMTTNTKTLNVTGFAPGIYMVRMVQGNNISTQKLVVK
jgi:hypothetical protein